MSASRPTIGVVIVSYNTRELLRACLESLRGCTLPLHTIVVDSASHDGSADMARSMFPEVEVVALDRNVGFAKGTNLGLQMLLEPQGDRETGRPGNRETRGPGDTGTRGHGGSGIRSEVADVSVAGALDFVLLLNPDTVVHPGSLEALAAFLAAHPRVGAVGPQLLNPDGSIQPAGFRFPTLLMTALDLFPPGEVLPGRLYNSWWHGRYPNERAGITPFPIDHPLGACIMARREVVEQVGPLDDAFFMYAEEVDWCFRTRRAGWAIWQVPEACVTHVGGAATSQFRQRMLIALYEGRLRFFRKHYSTRFVRWHTRIVRAGMLRATLLAWRDYMCGALSGDELRARLWAYARVAQL